jgi:hypothetical protein
MYGGPYFHLILGTWTASVLLADNFSGERILRRRSSEVVCHQARILAVDRTAVGKAVGRAGQIPINYFIAGTYTSLRMG